MCHCLACQKRTGSVFAAQARFARSQITLIEGRETQFVRVGDSGSPITFHFCPICGSTVYFEMKGEEPPFTSDFVAIAVGAFADPNFPPPRASVYEARRHAWTQTPSSHEMEHWD